MELAIIPRPRLTAVLGFYGFPTYYLHDEYATPVMILTATHNPPSVQLCEEKIH